MDSVDSEAYLVELCRDLAESVQSGDSAIALRTDIESTLLPTDRTIPIGLIVNELVTNAFKYAFPSGTKGTVAVTLRREHGNLCLMVADDGIGIDPQRADSGLGSRLISALTRQLGGQLVRVTRTDGTTVRLTFPPTRDA